MRMQRLFFLLLFLGLFDFVWAQDEERARFYFNPVKIRRDPFLPPAMLQETGANELTSYDLNEMSLVAILSGMGASKAMVLLPSGKTHIVQKGDMIGRNRGRIANITANEVIVRESFKDYKGAVKTSTAKLILED